MDDQPRAHWSRLRGVTEIHMPTELHLAQLHARRGGRMRCVSGQLITVHKGQIPLLARRLLAQTAFWLPKGGERRPRRVGRPEFRVFFFPLLGSFRGILVAFEAPRPSNVHVWTLRMSGETPGGLAEGDSGGAPKTHENLEHNTAPTHHTTQHNTTQPAQRGVGQGVLRGVVLGKVDGQKTRS